MLIPRLQRSIIALALAMTVGSAACADPAPAVENAICRPTFQVAGQPLAAGTAFVLDVDAPSPRTLLVSAFHLFGPAGGLREQIKAEQIAEHVSGARCQAIATSATWQAGPALTIDHAWPMGSDTLLDVAALVFDGSASDSPPTHLRLAANSPKSGDTVWLLAQVVGGAPRTQLLHRAVVNYSKDDALQYRFDTPDLELRATSGAPVLNADGEVVGLNLGGRERSDAVYGTADSLVTLRKALGSAY